MEEKYYVSDYDDEGYDYIAPSSSGFFSLMCFPFSVNAACCVSREIRANSLNLKKVVLTAEQTKQYQTPWERQQKKLKKKHSKKICLCWCCLCTCLYSPMKNHLRRRVSSNVEQKASYYKKLLESNRPTTEQLQKWTLSFDEFINDEAGMNFFEFFLRQEHSEENLKFWVDVNKLRKIECMEEKRAKMRNIYMDYLKPLAAKEVNISGTTRKKIEEELQNDPKENVFDAAQAQVYTMMHRQSYPRFLTSELFHAAVQNSYAFTKTADNTEEGQKSS